MYNKILLSSFAILTSISAFADGTVLPATAGATATGTPAIPPAPSPFGALVPFGLMFVVIYFLMIRPQQKKQKEQQDMLGGLKAGDEVATNSGILGKIVGLTDKVVTLEVADKVRVKFLKSQVGTVIKGSIKDLEGTA